MRILIVHKLWHVKGGVERYVLRLNNLLTGRGHEVVPFTCAHPDNEYTGFESFYPPYRDLSKPRLDREAVTSAANIVYSREARDSISRLLDAVQPDIVHCRNIYHHLSPSILYELKQRGIPVVMTVADYKLVCPCYRLFRDGRPCKECKGGRYDNAVRNRCVKGSLAASVLSATEAYVHRFAGAYVRNLDAILSPSRFVRGILSEFGLPENKLDVVRHFLDPAEWTPSTSSTRPGGRQYVVCFGRVSDEKGIDVAIAAVGKLKNVDLYVVGEGPEEPALRRLAEKVAPDRVRFLGYRQGDDLRGIIRGSLAVLMPSIWYEPFGLSIIESFALGRPVIGSRMGAIPELVTDGKTGWTFEVGDADGLAKKISSLVTHPDEADRMGAEARRVAETDFGPDAHYRALMRVYESIMKGGASDAARSGVVDPGRETTFGDDEAESA